MLPVKRSRVLNGMIVSRMTFGVVAWAFPGPVGRAFGLDMTRNPEASYLARLMGARDVVLAWGLIATEGEAQRKWLLTLMAMDATDTLAAIVGRRNGLSRRTTALLLAAALAPMVRGAIALNAREQ
jgi:dolichol kinase